MTHPPSALNPGGELCPFSFNYLRPTPKGDVITATAPTPKFHRRGHFNSFQTWFFRCPPHALNEVLELTFLELSH